MSSRTSARLAALPAATAAVALSLTGPASAHVGATVDDASAGAYTIATFSVPHGCEGSPTTRVEVQVPESVLSVTPTRNPYYDVEASIERLEDPVSDSHGNEVTERTASITYTARTPLPEGQRDTFELSFQVPDAAGEVLTWPTIQTCEKGSTSWTEVAAEGQDEDELDHPAPSFEILPASGGGDHHGAGEDAEQGVEASDGSSAPGWIGLGAGLLGLAAGGLALARTRTTS